VDKRTFLKSVLLGVAGVYATGFYSRLKAAKTKKKWDGIFKLPVLPYAFDALEPFIDAETMKLHYNTHHASYTNQFNAAVSAAGLVGKTAHELLRNTSEYPESIRHNGGGYMNHRFFWSILSPASDKKPSPDLIVALERDFGSFENFQSQFNKSAKSVFGSGWTWLIADKYGKLKVTSTLNQDNPIMDIATDKGIPLLCLDLWEHAYYIKNGNRRADYIESFWHVVNWDVVSKRFIYSQRLGVA
jgi:Fe-Mn family superoxide dismutase